ncbi:MAG: ComEC family competence protein [Alphaproteobacteria bacterium]|nr:ComEC family competence protein [Alphaproteobacteria bacterium]
MKDQLYAEIAAQRPQAILLVPVCLACGIGLYFSLMFEPRLFYGVCVLGLSLLTIVFSKGGMRFVFIGVMIFALGFVAAQIRTHVSYTPILSKKMDFKVVEGRIAAIEMLDKGARLTLSEVSIEGLGLDETPRKIRLKLWKSDGLGVGQRVRGLAALNPPSPPVIPRGFDFQRYMYFRGIGAVGFMYGPPTVIDDDQVLRMGGWIERVRQIIGARIDAALDAPQMGLARAFMIGQRTSIEDDDMAAIRASGLAHMLAISGLHVGLFSGAVFFVMRFAMAMFPAFALRFPIKKYAAVGAMVAALFYMLIAGATIPTQRAMISVAVVFCAILLDRSPISLRVVAFAAFWVLVFFPESLMSASFQMSFAAVTALVGFYDWSRPLWSEWARQAGMVKKAGLYFVGVASTTVIATVSTAPLTLFHFQALPIYGLLANIICVPLLAFYVMPLAILAFVLMPFGMEGIALSLMEAGLSVIIWLAHFVAGIEGAVLHVPAFELWAMVCFVFACISVIVLRGRFRVILVSAFGVLTLVNFQWIQYDVMVSSKTDLIALDAKEAQLIVSDARRSRFKRENWQLVMGFEGEDVTIFPKDGEMRGEDYVLSCDIIGCRYETSGRKFSYLKEFDISAFHDECLWADVIIAMDVYDQPCDAQYVVNRRESKYHRVHAFSVHDDGIVMQRVDDFRGIRPWVQTP